MHHQVTIVPGLEGESASQPPQRPAFFVARIESKDNHVSTVKCGCQDASRVSEISAMQIGGRQIRRARVYDVGDPQWFVRDGTTAIGKATRCGSQSRRQPKAQTP